MEVTYYYNSFTECFKAAVNELSLDRLRTLEAMKGKFTGGYIVGLKKGNHYIRIDWEELSEEDRATKREKLLHINVGGSDFKSAHCIYEEYCSKSTQRNIYEENIREFTSIVDTLGTSGLITRFEIINEFEE